MAKWKLDTGNSGNDEILEGFSRDEVLQDVLNHHEIDEMPEGWTLEEVEDVEAEKTYYACCNVNGPISVEIVAKSVESALEKFAALNHRECIDNCRTDAEDELDIDCTGFDEDAFDEAMREKGYRVVADMSDASGHDGRLLHVVGGWLIYGP